MAKKITLKNKNGDVLCPHTAIEQVQGLKEALDNKLGKTEKAASATNANTSKKLCTAAYGGGDSNLNTFTVTDGSVEYRSIIPNTAANMPDPAGYQNSVMSFGLHDNGATAQMFFAKDKPLYYRSSQTAEWNQIAYKSDVDKAFNYLGYNLDLNNFYDNENKSGTVYINVDGGENLTNAPDKYGCAVNFGAGVSNFQLFSPAFSNKLYHRNRWWSERNGEWKEWKQLRTIDDKVTTSHIADAAITPAKIQTSIALNGTPSMTVEPTTSSPDKTIASVGLVKEAVDGIEIGGTNLLRYIKDDGSSYWDGGSGVTCDVTIDGDVIKGQTNGNNNPRIYNSSTKEIVWEPNTDYVLSYYAKGQGDYSALIIIEGNNVNFCPFSDMGVYSSEWKKYVKKFTTPSDIIDANTQLLKFYCGHRNANDTTSWLEVKDIKIERGNKATDWSPAPEDVQANISNAETRSKAFAEDYTNAEIDKIENGQTVAQKANSLYDDDSGTYKNWGEIDTAITRKIGDKFEDYATKSYVQDELSKQVSVPIASETEYGKLQFATPEDVTAVENDLSAVNDTAKAVTPYTLKEYIASKSFVTSSELSSQLGNINTILNSIINQ